MGKRTDGTDVTITIPETPPTPVIVATPEPSVPEPAPPSNDMTVGELVEWRRSMDEWRNERDTEWNRLNESTQATQETLSTLLTNVRELTESVRNQAATREVILPLPIAETQEQEPDNPDDDETNPTTTTAPVQALNPVTNAPQPHASNRRVLHKRRNGHPNTYKE